MGKKQEVERKGELAPQGKMLDCLQTGKCTQRLGAHTPMLEDHSHGRSPWHPGRAAVGLSK